MLVLLLVQQLVNYSLDFSATFSDVVLDLVELKLISLSHVSADASYLIFLGK
jgi:hypothetical protein